MIISLKSFIFNFFKLEFLFFFILFRSNKFYLVKLHQNITFQRYGLSREIILNLIQSPHFAICGYIPKTY
jgi:hypothetical protein